MTNEQLCQSLWEAVKAMDNIKLDSPNKQRTLDTALSFIAKDCNIIFKMLGVL
jgi:hypothetical protein